MEVLQSCFVHMIESRVALYRLHVLLAGVCMRHCACKVTLQLDQTSVNGIGMSH